MGGVGHLCPDTVTGVTSYPAIPVTSGVWAQPATEPRRVHRTTVWGAAFSGRGDLGLLRKRDLWGSPSQSPPLPNLTRHRSAEPLLAAPLFARRPLSLSAPSGDRARAPSAFLLRSCLGSASPQKRFTSAPLPEGQEEAEPAPGVWRPSRGRGALRPALGSRGVGSGWPGLHPDPGDSHSGFTAVLFGQNVNISHTSPLREVWVTFFLKKASPTPPPSVVHLFSRRPALLVLSRPGTTCA